MERAEFKARREAERLRRWLSLGPPRGTSADRVCVWQDGEQWRIAITNERAGVIETTRRAFETESVALADALSGLRMLKSLHEL